MGMTGIALRTVNDDYRGSLGMRIIQSRMEHIILFSGESLCDPDGGQKWREC